MASIVNTRNNHIVMSGIARTDGWVTRLEGNSDFLKVIDEDRVTGSFEKKVIMHDNYDRESVSDILFAELCWATKEEWSEFDRIFNLDGADWYYMEVDATEPLYDATSLY